jgi:hypothetical protein
VRLEGLGKLKKKIHLIKTLSHYLPVCSTVPQSTTLPRAPINDMNNKNNCKALTNINFNIGTVNVKVNMSLKESLHEEVWRSGCVDPSVLNISNRVRLRSASSPGRFSPVNRIPITH